MESHYTSLIAPTNYTQSAPPTQTMDHQTPVNEPNTASRLMCPSAGSCCLSMLSPCTLCCSFRLLSERQEMVVLNWGKFLTVVREPACYFINPCGMDTRTVSTAIQTYEVPQLKVVDSKGNPLNVSGVVTFQVVDTRRALLDVQNWSTYIAQQSEVVLKQICSSHPYESNREGEDSLKKEAANVRTEIVSRLQVKAERAGIRVLNFEFKELSYAPEIAALMLVRQQAEAMLEARKIVVEGGVSISTSALHHLKEQGIEYSPADAARLTTNLILTICSESRVTPTISL
jgi:hypothetical protein